MIADKEGKFDVIIDDGSHFNWHRIFTFEHSFGNLKDGGLYIIEDMQTSFWGGEVNGVKWDGAQIGDSDFAQTCCGYFLQLAICLNESEFINQPDLDERRLALARQIQRIAFEHNLIIVCKKQADGRHSGRTLDSRALRIGTYKDSFMRRSVRLSGRNVGRRPCLTGQPSNCGC